MGMYGSRGYRGFHDSLEYADWKRKADREDAISDTGHRAILTDWNEETRTYDTCTIVNFDADRAREDRDERRMLEAAE